MARIRSIHPGFAKSGDIAVLSKPCRLHFALLWTYADDHGRGKDDVRLIKAECWPLDDDVTVKKVEAMQTELERHGRILRYEVNGRRYFQVTNWGKYQHPQKPRPSEYPDAPVPVALPDAYDTPVVALPSVVGGEKEREREGTLAPASPPARRDLLFEAVAEATGTDWRNGGMTTRARQALNAAVADLRQVEADPDDVPVRAARYRQRFPDAPLTANALAKHWPALGTDGPVAVSRHQRGVAEFMQQVNR